MTSRVFFDPLRKVSAADIDSTYNPVGLPVSGSPRFLKIVNNTDGDIVLTDDSSVSEGKMIFISKSFAVYDLQSNMNAQNETSAVLPRKTQFFAKSSMDGSIPTTGILYIEVMF